MRLELRKQLLGKRLAQFFQRLGRQLFGKQFNEKIGRGHEVCKGERIKKAAGDQAGCIGWRGSICSTHSRGASGKPRRARLS